MIKSYLDALEALINALNEPETTEDIPFLTKNVNRSQRDMVNWMSSKWIYRGTPFTEAMLSAYSHSLETGNSFRDSIITSRAHIPGNPPSLDAFSGVLMAYEYQFQDESKLIKRRTAEKKAFSTLRRELETKKDDLVLGINKIRDEFGAWKNGLDDWQGSNVERQDRRYKVHGRLIQRQIREQENKFASNIDEWKSRVSQLEETYRDKLRLSAPASYWRKRAKDLGRQGGLWATLLIVISLVVAVLSGCFFWSWLHKEPVPFGVQSLQGVVLFAATAAASTFVIRTLSRLTFSAFHLQRDAEEREQLSHLYLALMQDGHADENSREIVLQALFSRAESGLIAGDSGPTMPSVRDLVAGLSRVKT